MSGVKEIRGWRLRRTIYKQINYIYIWREKKERD